MKFSELREADLSKAQIKKVHDKADDLPKNDFIKRYGKDGDAVRFATATNIVKKQLGIDESIIGVNKKSVEYKNGRAAAEKGVKYDKNPHAPGTKRLNWSMGHNDFRADTLRKSGKPNYGARGQFEDYEEGFKSDAQRKAAFASGYKEKGKNKKEELDDKDKETIKPIIKQLQKSVKAHGKQAKQLQKDIKDEVEEGGPGSGPRHKEVTLTRNGKTKTVKGVAAKIFTDAGWKLKEEVELDEVHFSNRGEPPAPKGMHKLRSGRDIPSTPQVDKIHKKVVLMTDMNDHFGARIEIAKQVGDKQLVQVFSSLKLIHDKYSGAVGNQAIELRNKFSPVLNNAIDRKFGKYADVIRDGL
jgi:hypothetical protein